MVRSGNYRNVFDTDSRFMRGRHENGEWIHPFNPQYPYYEYMYREANAWQVSFYVPHDMPGLVELYGGKQNFEEKLDSLFRSEEHTSELQSLMRISYAVFCLKKKTIHTRIKD